jgi:biotin carboxyl carrier protein
VTSGGSHRLTGEDATWVVRSAVPPAADGTLRLEVDGRMHEATVTVEPGPGGPAAVWVHADGVTRRLARVAVARPADLAELAGGAAFGSPMPGSVLAVEVAAGDHVPAGATMVVVEAMKMEHPVVAPADGVVTEVHVGVGDPVEAGTTLVAFQADGAGPDGDGAGPDSGPEPGDDTATVDAASGG